MDQSCIVCCLSYNVTTRRPFDLGCGHCVCEQCFNTSKLTICVECRQPTNNPHLQYTLLRMLQPSSPTSFPIGGFVDDAVDEAPGTPHPSAPVMEVEPWGPDDSDYNSSRRTSSSLHSSSTGSLRCHRLSQQSNASTVHAPAAAGAAMAPAAYPLLPDSGRNSPLAGSSTAASLAAAAAAAAALNNSSSHDPVPVHALTFTAAAWTTMSAAAPSACNTLALGALASPSGVSAGGNSNGSTAAAAAAALVSHQLLTSFPVADFDLLDYLPESPTSSSCSSQDGLLDGQEAAGHGQQAAAGVPANKALAAMQGAVSSCVGLLQQLMVPHAMFEQGTRQGWPAPGPSLLLAITGSCCRSWSAYSAAVATTLSHCTALQQLLVSRLGRLLTAVGLPNRGHLAAYWLATWLLGFLLYHWHLGLQLAPVAAASLALVAFGAMPSSSGGCILWPAKLAGAVLAGVCFVLGLLGVVWQQVWLGAGLLHAQLLAATPQVLLLVLLLLWGQVVMEVVAHGWSSYRELKFASLVVRCWCVAAAGVLLGGPAAALHVLLAAVPWVQKCHLLLEGPVVVHHLGLLLQPSSSYWAPAAQQQQVAGPSSGRHKASSSNSRRAGGSAGASSSRSSSDPSSMTDSNGDGGGSSAWLLCVHCLLQLLLLLFVPPAPLAAVAWLPLVARSALVWSARVLLCGCIVQLLLGMAPIGGQLAMWHASSTHTGSSSSSSRRGDGVQTGLRCATPCMDGPVDHCCGGSPIRNHGRMMLPGTAEAGCSAAAACGSPPQAPAAAAARWELQLQLHSSISHGLSAAAAGATHLVHGTSSSFAIAAGAAAVVKQHSLYLILLLLAAAGDSFIMAVPSAAAAVAVRAAWHVCVEQVLVLMFVLEVAAALWHEVLLLRHQHYLLATRQQPLHRRPAWTCDSAVL